MMAPTVVAPLSETVTPALVMMAVSLAPGTVFGFQLAAVFQPPLAELVQLMVAERAKLLPRASATRDTIKASRRVFINGFPASIFVLLKRPDFYFSPLQKSS